MSTTTRHDNQSIVPDSADVDSAVADAINQLADEVATLRDEVADLREENAELRDELKEEREKRGTEVAETRQDLADLRSTIEDTDSGGADPTPETTQTDSLTPIERLSEGDRDDVTQHVTPSIERAVSLFEHITDWGSKTPRGYTLRPADNPKQLLEAATDESLAWQQYYRAAEALEQLTRGAVTFFDHQKHGKTLVLHEDTAVHDRATAAETGRSRTSLAAD